MNGRLTPLGKAALCFGSRLPVRWGFVPTAVRSACVIFTTLPNACLGAGASVGFHGSNVNAGPIGNQQMARYLRGEAKRRFVAEWQYIPTTEIHKIKAVDYVKLDPQVKICKD